MLITYQVATAPCTDPIQVKLHLDTVSTVRGSGWVRRKAAHTPIRYRGRY